MISVVKTTQKNKKNKKTKNNKINIMPKQKPKNKNEWFQEGNI